MGKEADALVSILKDHWARVWDMWQEMIRTIPDSEWAKGDSSYLAPERYVIHTLDCAYVLTGDFPLDRYDPNDTHSRAWQPFLAQRYGNVFAETIIRDARERLESLIPELPYIGGDENPMTRHIIRSSTSLALYKAMKARGKSVEGTGKIIYDAVVESVRYLPPYATALPQGW